MSKLAVSIGVIAMVLAAGAASAADLAAHRAVYSMKLHSARASGGITGASGAMTYRFADACDGWVVENRTALSFSYSEGNQITTNWEFVTWESKDGLRYRFHVRSSRNGEVMEEIDGTARLDGFGMGGVATFTRPEPMTVKLPKGTMFPTEHTLRLLERAEAGDKVFMRTVFDGSGTDGPFDVNALIGKRLPAGNPKQPLLAGPSWRIGMAFFPVDSKVETPDYEVALRYFSNGVAVDVVQNFGDFALRADLDTLEPLPPPDC